jgi:hypothetical protein
LRLLERPTGAVWVGAVELMPGRLELERGGEALSDEFCAARVVCIATRARRYSPAAAMLRSLVLLSILVGDEERVMERKALRSFLRAIPMRLSASSSQEKYSSQQTHLQNSQSNLR